MNKAQLELQIQQQTQQDLSNLKHDVGQLINAYALIDSNMRKSYSMMVAEQNKLAIRVNFLIDQAIKSHGNKEEFEQIFKEYEKEQTGKMQEEIVKIIKAQEEDAAKKAKEDGSNGTGSPIIQGWSS